MMFLTVLPIKKARKSVQLVKAIEGPASFIAWESLSTSERDLLLREKQSTMCKWVGEYELLFCIKDKRMESQTSN